MRTSQAFVSPEAIAFLNNALNKERQERGLQTDVELAVNMGLSPKTISFWRNGRFTHADAVLVNLLTSTDAESRH